MVTTGCSAGALLRSGNYETTCPAPMVQEYNSVGDCTLFEPHPRTLQTYVQPSLNLDLGEREQDRSYSGRVKSTSKHIKPPFYSSSSVLPRTVFSSRVLCHSPTGPRLDASPRNGPRRRWPPEGAREPSGARGGSVVACRQSRLGRRHLREAEHK